jgi:hypothetical protein
LLSGYGKDTSLIGYFAKIFKPLPGLVKTYYRKTGHPLFLKKIKKIKKISNCSIFVYRNSRRDKTNCRKFTMVVGVITGVII